MSTYFNRKKLLNENSDLYISEYDKSLPTQDLGGIIEAKRSYNKAKLAGDVKGMEDANKKANQIRKNSASYTGGVDGSEYNRNYKDYEVRINTYTSPYDKEKKRVSNAIKTKEEFSYDPYDDPLYAVYEKIYRQLGEDAYDRALSKNALRTGGVASTSAQSLAMQAQNKYNSLLSSKIPELYEKAYKQYMDEYENLYKELEMLEKLDDKEYKIYRDSMSDFEKDREYYAEKDKQIKDNIYNEYKYNTNLEYNLEKDKNELDFKRERGDMEDAKWNLEYDQKTYSDNLTTIIALAKAVYGDSNVTADFIKELINGLGFIG